MKDEKAVEGIMQDTMMEEEGQKQKRQRGKRRRKIESREKGKVAKRGEDVQKNG